MRAAIRQRTNLAQLPPMDDTLITASTWRLRTGWQVMWAYDRELTLSAYRQLDEVPFEEIVPSGRVRPEGDDGRRVQVVGRHKLTIALVRSWAWKRAMTCEPSRGEVAEAQPTGFVSELDMAELAAVAAAPDTAAQLTHPAQAEREIAWRKAQRQWMTENGQDWEALPLIILA